MLRTYELVYIFVLSYTPYFHIVESSTDDSKQDRYCHGITMHVATSDYAGMITNYDIRCYLVLIPRYMPVRVVQRPIRYGLVRVVRVDIKIPFSNRT